MNYLEITENVDDTIILPPAPTYVCIEVVDQAEAEALLPQVVLDYFTGLQYKAVFHKHYHGPDVHQACEIIPL